MIDGRILIKGPGILFLRYTIVDCMMKLLWTMAASNGKIAYTCGEPSLRATSWEDNKDQGPMVT